MLHDKKWTEMNDKFKENFKMAEKANGEKGYLR
jgi:hypothetical protein